MAMRASRDKYHEQMWWREVTVQITADDDPPKDFGQLKNLKTWIDIWEKTKEQRRGETS